MADDFTARYGDLLTGSYDCVDRIVLNAYYPLGHNPGGFRVWWRRWHGDSDAELDDAHLMRLAGRFARRVRAWAAANGVPVIDFLNGHEYVACQAHAAGIGFIKEGNCFTWITDPRSLAQIAGTLSQPAAIGRLGQACDRWIYSACLCSGLDLAEQQASRFRYDYSVYQAEYSRNLIFASGARMDRVFGTIADRTRSRLDVPSLRTLFGVKKRPAGTGQPSLKLAVVIERPQYDLTLFKVHFGLLTLKGYTKGAMWEGPPRRRS